MEVFFILKKKNNKSKLFTLTFSCAMVALSVIFTRFLGFSPEGTPFRFEIGFLPIAITSYVAGPLYAALSYLTADVIGSLFSGYAPNLWITLCQALSGVIMGFFFYKKKHSAKRTVLCFSLIAIFIEILLKSPIFVILYDWTPGFALATRTLNAVINLPIRIITYHFILKALMKPLGIQYEKQ